MRYLLEFSCTINAINFSISIAIAVTYDRIVTERSQSRLLYFVQPNTERGQITIIFFYFMPASSVSFGEERAIIVIASFLYQ